MPKTLSDTFRISALSALLIVEMRGRSSDPEPTAADGAAANRIPYEILEMPDAETIFKNHLNRLHVHQKVME